MRKQNSFLLSLLFIFLTNLLTFTHVSAKSAIGVLIETKKGRLIEINNELKALKAQAVQIEKMKGAIPSTHESNTPAIQSKKVSPLVESAKEASVSDPCQCNIEIESYAEGSSCKGDIGSTSSLKRHNSDDCKKYKKEFAAGTCSGMAVNGQTSSYYDNGKCN